MAFEHQLQMELIRQAKARVELRKKAFGAEPPPKFSTREVLVSGAVNLWSLFVENTDAKPGEITDVTLIDNAVTVAVQLLLKNRPKDAALVAASMEKVAGTLVSSAVIQWADCGLPKVEIGHRFAAALLTTDVTSEALAQVKPPWRSFVIEIPDGLLESYNDDKKRTVPIRSICVCQIHSPHGPWAFVAFTDSPMMIHRFGLHAHQLLPPKIKDEENFSDKCYKVTETDGRVATLIGQLIINVCLIMSDPGMVRPTGGAHEVWAHANNDPRKLRGEMRRFRVGTEVEVDLRQQVRQFMRGEPEEVPVGTLIRGHFRTQRYGKELGLTRLIWRRPMRPHSKGGRP